MNDIPERDTGLTIEHFLPTEVPDVWQEVADMLKRAIDLSGGRYAMNQTLHELLLGKTTLWVVKDGEEIIAAWVLRLIEFPGRKTLYGDLLAGDRMKEWAHLMDEAVQDWARKFRCDYVEIGGRDGWLRFAKPYGYEKAYWVMEKKVEYNED